VQYRVTKETLMLNLPDSQIKKIAAQAKGGKDIVFNFQDTPDITEIRLTKTALYTLGKTGSDLIFILPDGKITISSDTAKQIAKTASGGSLVVSLKTTPRQHLNAAQKTKVKSGDLIYSFTLTADRKPVAGFGAVTVKIPYEGKTPETASAWLLKPSGKNGKLEKTDCVYDAKTGEITVILGSV
jgi:hypothetical protein